MKTSGAIKSVDTATEEKRNIKHSETSRNGGCKEFSYTFWGDKNSHGSTNQNMEDAMSFLSTSPRWVWL